MKYFLLGLLLVAGVMAYPTLSGYVTDNANLLSAQEEQALTSRIADIEQRTSVEIAIITVQNTEGDNRVLYANRIGEQNGVGKADTDNGIVILWSLENKPGGAIATGRGIGDVLNDAKVGRIGRASREYFDREDYFEGFSSILTAIDAELSGTAQETQSGDNIVPLIVLIIIILIIVILITSSKGRSSGYYRTGSYVGRSWSSGGWSGGGGSFGGGSFGGGGSGF